MDNKERFQLAGILLLQFVLVSYVFSGFFLEPFSYMLNNRYDGLKNYYTLITYVLQDASFGYGYYSFMNYPIGDYIVFTDNTPFLAILMRFWHLNISSLEGLVTPIFNIAMLINIVTAFLLSYAIGRQLKMKVGISALLAFVLTWFSPMLISIVTGVPNLSVSSFLLANILLLIKFFHYLAQENKRRIIIVNISLFCLVVISTFFHIYYLAIEGIFTGIFLVGLLFHYRKKKEIITIFATLGTLILAAVTVMTIIRITDPFYTIRPEKGGGYDWDPWNMSLSGIFKGYTFLLHPVFGINDWAHKGKFGFVGHFALLMLFFRLVYFLIARKKHPITVQDGKGNFLVMLLLIAGLINLFTSIGNHIPIFGLKIDNFLSPFFFAKKFLAQVQQFRFLTRLQWPFFFVINIWAFYQLNKFLESKIKNTLKNILLIGSLIAIGIDGYGFLHFYKTAKATNTFNEESFKSLPEIPKNKYQAILPIPYFQVGNERLEYTIDDNDKWSTYIFKLSVNSKLPLIAGKMSRTPFSTSKLLYSIFTDPQLPEELRKQLNEKPILVVTNDKIEMPGKKSEFTKMIFERGPEIIKEKNMKFLFEKDDVRYYEWHLNF